MPPTRRPRQPTPSDVSFSRVPDSAARFMLTPEPQSRRKRPRRACSPAATTTPFRASWMTIRRSTSSLNGALTLPRSGRQVATTNFHELHDASRRIPDENIKQEVMNNRQVVCSFFLFSFRQMAQFSCYCPSRLHCFPPSYRISYNIVQRKKTMECPHGALTESSRVERCRRLSYRRLAVHPYANRSPAPLQRH